MNKLKVTFVQSALHWQNTDANLMMLEAEIKGIKGNTDLILLPEMFTTGFSMNAAIYAESPDSKTLGWMRRMAAKTGAMLIGSFIVQEHELYYNRLYCVEPDGSVDHYDKRHLFRLGDEHQTFEPGSKRLIKNWKEWKICPLICYDLRFPVWARNRYNPTTSSFDYDLLIFTANWPASRNTVWNTLLQARAIENQSYTAGLNIIGSDGMGIQYCGNSQLIDFKGNILLHMADKLACQTVTIDKSLLNEFRTVFPVHLDADGFSIT